MLFKNETIAAQYRGSLVKTEDGYRVIRVAQELKDVALMLDILALYNHCESPKDITITDLISFFRTSPSLHPLGRAMDIRTSDWSPKFRAAMEGGFFPILRQINPEFHYLFEDAKSDGHEGWTAPHLHIQWGTLKEDNK